MIQRRVAVFFAFSLLVIASISYTLARGGPWERAPALVTLVGVVISPVAAHERTQLWQGRETGLLLVDVAALAAYVAIMAHSGRFWPIWTTAFQLLTVAAHLGPMFRHTHLSVPFAFDEEIWSWIILVQLLVVTRLGSKERDRR